MTTPNDFHRFEVLYGAPRRLSNTFRLSLPLDSALREYARQNETEISIVLRHAATEYLQRRGIECGCPVPATV